MFGSILGPALSFVGGLIGNEKADDRASDQDALQREFAQHGIRWKVEDAKAAGLHPLFAIGGSGATYSPSPVQYSDLGQSMGEMGQALTRAVAGQETPEERVARDLQRKLLEAQIDEHSARAQLLRSQAGNPQPASVGLPSPRAGAELDNGAQALPYREVKMPEAVELSSSGGEYGSFPGQFDVIKPKPVEIESANPHAPWAAAGPARPGFGEFRITRYMKMMLPINEEGWTEGLESVPYWMYPIVYQANVDRYGPHFWRLALQELGGRDSKFVQWLSRSGLPPFPPDSRGQWRPIRGAN